MVFIKKMANDGFVDDEDRNHYFHNNLSNNVVDICVYYALDDDIMVGIRSIEKINSKFWRIFNILS